MKASRFGLIESVNHLLAVLSLMTQNGLRHRGRLPDGGGITRDQDTIDYKSSCPNGHVGFFFSKRDELGKALDDDSLILICRTCGVSRKPGAEEKLDLKKRLEETA